MRRARARRAARRRKDESTPTAASGAKAGEAFSPRTKIMLGAAQAFGARGYEATSVEDILKAAGVSRRTFYRAFRSKDDLFEHMFEQASIVFLQSIRAAAALGKTPEEKMGNCVEVYLRVPQTAGPIFHVFQTELQRPGSRLASRRDHVIDELIAMLQEGVAEHGGEPVDELVLRGLVAALERISLFVFTKTDAGEDEIRRAKAAMMHIVKSTLGPPDA